MSMSVDPNARFIAPEGLPLAILVISIVFLVISLFTVSLRTYLRLEKGIFGLDDTFMVIGTVAYIPVTGLASYACFVGLGRLEEDINAWQAAQAMKYYVIWILTYVLALATIKSSICVTIMRIASTKMNLLIAIYVLLGITWASFFITFIGTLLYCQPVQTMWTPQLALDGKGSCAPTETFIIIAHTATVSTIVTDLALVVVPAIILWNTQMQRQAKLQAFGLLSFASVASIITMVRIPFVNKFGAQTNLPFWVAHIMLCSNVETGIGCIASSIPSLRHFIRGESVDGSDGPSNKRSGGSHSKFYTIGSEPRQRKFDADGFRNPTDIGFSLSTVHHPGNNESWERLHDGDACSESALDPRGIQKQQVYAVDVEMNNMEADNHPHAR